MVEIKPPTTFKYDLNHPCPVFFVPYLPGEEFVMIPDHAADVLPYYAISNYGRVWHVYENKFMAPSVDGRGYEVVVLVNKMGFPKNFRVHRLVMLTFRYDEYLKMFEANPLSRIVVCHIDDNKRRNFIDCPMAPDNLKWGTQSQNMLDAHATGVKKPSSLSTQKVHRICRMIKDGKSNREIINLMPDISESIIDLIRNKKTWTHISYQYF